MPEPTVVHADEAFNWAAVGLGADPERLQVRILRGALGCTELGVSVVRLGPGTKVTTGHRHPAGEEVYVLVAGRAEAKVDDAVVALEPLSALRVPGEAVRALRCVGSEEAVFVVASHPQDRPELTEFVPGFWPAEPGETPVEVRLTLT
jgi:quercetin dioxygenase-like cupin family protein